MRENMGTRRKNNSVGEKILPILSHLNVTDSRRLLCVQKEQEPAALNSGLITLRKAPVTESDVKSSLDLIFLHEYSSP